MRPTVRMQKRNEQIWLFNFLCKCFLGLTTHLNFKTPKVAYCSISLITVYSFTFAVNILAKKTQFTLIINITRWQSHSASIHLSDLQCP